MSLSNMSYKGFVWPHNPGDCSLEADRSVIVKKLPEEGWITMDMGLSGAALKGSGEFYGDSAYQQFMELYEVFRSEGSGELYHPVLGTWNAYFTKLKMTQKPQADHVYYSFEFCRCEDEAVASVTADYKTYTLESGDTFWSVCRKFSLSPEELVTLNPDMGNPASLTAGAVIRVG